MEAVYDEPNEETVAAMKEAKEGKGLETLDLAKFKEFVASLQIHSYVDSQIYRSIQEGPEKIPEQTEENRELDEGTYLIEANWERSGGILSA